MIIVDTLVVASFWLPGDFTEAAVQAYRKDPAWAAPFLWRWQFRNLVAARIRRRDFPFDLGLKFLAGAEAMLKDREFFIPYGQVMDLVSQSRSSAYVCEFVALAKDLDARLITIDPQILADFPKSTQHLSDFVES